MVMEHATRLCEDNKLEGSVGVQEVGGSCGEVECTGFGRVLAQIVKYARQKDKNKFMVGNAINNNVICLLKATASSNVYATRADRVRNTRAENCFETRESPRGVSSAKVVHNCRRNGRGGWNLVYEE